MGSIPDDEVSEQTNLRLLGRCADTALNSQRELEHTCGTYLKIESENGTLLKIHEFPTTFGTCFSLQAFFCLQLSQIQWPKINRSCALQALRLSAGKLSSSAWIPTLGLLI